MIIKETKRYQKWFRKLTDIKTRSIILAKVQQLGFGQFSDCKDVGEKVIEKRIHYGPGYRIYFTVEEDTVLLLLTGGEKSTQQQDIIIATKLAKRWRED
ncbi:MAG: hypothetical protein LBC58_04850 [Clostridiales Family XIII bacterium]|jgi:putative addiction module killer protein|nr:hypothetical protein [Clostridiales Family XIII bacterium]